MESNERGNKIKILRIKSGMSQEALAESSQLNLRTIQRIENGTTAARGDSLQRIARALGANIKDLMNAVLQVDSKIPALEKDPWISRLLYISALGFLIFPLLGVLLPLALWIRYRNTISEMYQKGKQLITIQLIWCVLLFALYAYLFSVKILQLHLPVPANQKFFTITVAALYLANIIYCLACLTGSFPIRKYLRQAFQFPKSETLATEKL